MATEGEFLRLLQMTESVRRCEGRVCLEVAESHIEQGKALEDHRTSHGFDAVLEGHDKPFCAECQVIDGQAIALRETMHSEGVDFPMGLLES